MRLQLRLANFKDKSVLFKQFAGLLSDDEEKQVNGATYTMLNTDKIQNSHFPPICFLVLEDIDTNTIYGAIAFSSAGVYAIHIEKQLRNLGYGRLLMSAAAEYVKAAKCDSICLTATETSVPFYERLGFKFEAAGNIMRFNAKKGRLSGEQFVSLCQLEPFANQLNVTIDPLYTEFLQKVQSVNTWFHLGTAHDYIYNKKNTSVDLSPEKVVSSDKESKKPAESFTFFNPGNQNSTESTPLVTQPQSAARCCSCTIS